MNDPTHDVAIIKKKLKGIVETGASCYNFQLKSLFVKCMLDTLFLSTYTLNVDLLFLLIKMYHVNDIPYHSFSGTIECNN